MTMIQIIAVVAAVCVAALYLKDFLPRSREPETLKHIRNIIAVRDAYKTPEVAERCNALMEALLGIKS